MGIMHVLSVAQRALPGAAFIGLSERTSHDTVVDGIDWRACLTVYAFGKSRFCYLDAADLRLSDEGLRAEIRKGWPELAQVTP